MEHTHTLGRMQIFALHRTVASGGGDVYDDIGIDRKQLRVNNMFDDDHCTNQNRTDVISTNFFSYNI